jgi:hypothetical protein
MTGQEDDMLDVVPQKHESILNCFTADHTWVRLVKVSDALRVEN